jgi:hypothetical protein
MSKTVETFFTRVRANYRITKRFGGRITPGHRIVPSRSKKNNKIYQLRIDAGELLKDGFRNVVLQVNAEAEDHTLVEWLRENPHGKLATGRYKANDEGEPSEDEILQLFGVLEDEAKGNL